MVTNRTKLKFHEGGVTQNLLSVHLSKANDDPIRLGILQPKMEMNRTGSQVQGSIAANITSKRNQPIPNDSLLCPMPIILVSYDNIC